MKGNLFMTYRLRNKTARTPKTPTPRTTRTMAAMTPGLRADPTEQRDDQRQYEDLKQKSKLTQMKSHGLLDKINTIIHYYR